MIAAFVARLVLLSLVEPDYEVAVSVNPVAAAHRIERAEPASAWLTLSGRRLALYFLGPDAVGARGIRPDGEELATRASAAAERGGVGALARTRSDLWRRPTPR